MDNTQKETITYLINELIKGDYSEEEGNKIYAKLDKLIIDPKWSDYIFWSNDCFDSNDGFVSHVFFDKIEQYQMSDEYKRDQYVICLVNNLLQRNFQYKSEMDIVNELNQLLPNTDWIDDLFVSKICLDEYGALYEHNFINLVFG